MDKKTPKQVEKDLKSLFEKYNVQEKVSVDDIKNWIWNATGSAMTASNKYNKKCLNLFSPIDDIDELNDVMQVFVDAWNFFPHKALKGKSPHEAYLEIYGERAGEQPRDMKDRAERPKVMVGGHEMELDEFHAMIKEMEKAQKPFKEWIEKDALPKYQKYLEQIVKTEKACEEHYSVADLFFQRALHLGFIDLKSIRQDFIQKEFPHWWPTHVMYSNLKPAGVKKSLSLFFEFIELVYGVKN
ncbi:MAG: hypothetical protein UT33_C0008G0053 [Candidatus Peregrinibacteria bacterium GW2011_GWC2_39_14]|nr:MAG: hypothetical protein US92_C0004G0053 [Candidatus Peregrinibacteria bacterium GW2011_GWA2_38_36]KKR06737.1 MAG: hypothetical protein UT33_C0008G0053 [Candidatus Peregrinibacteria bacterium GW2011_GWC2_39_14]